MDRTCFGFEYKFADNEPDGTFEGHGAVFNVEDAGGDLIVPGAFKSVLPGGSPNAKMPKMLLQHAGMPYAAPTPENLIPVGKWTAASEDSKGLQMKGRLINLDTESGKRIYGAMKEGELNSLSIGYKVGHFTRGAKAGEPKRTIKSMVALPEVSLVTFPMQDMAAINSVKSATGIKSIREFEDFLRDVGGYSNAAAKSIAARGFKAYQPEPRDEDGNGDDLATLLQRCADTIRSNS